MGNGLRTAAWPPEKKSSSLFAEGSGARAFNFMSSVFMLPTSVWESGQGNAPLEVEVEANSGPR